MASRVGGAGSAGAWLAAGLPAVSTLNPATRASAAMTATRLVDRDMGTSAFRGTCWT